MPQLCHEGRDTHVTGGAVDVVAAQHHSVSWHILGAAHRIRDTIAA
jgi:hypothetical protein